MINITLLDASKVPVSCHPHSNRFQRFNRNSDLCGHYRIHTSERLYKCGAEGCDKHFIQQSTLTVHSRTYTGEKALYVRP
ncbi:hypothetical protein BDW75DRAFT_215697 [Aspergillus navahoensis]